MFPFLFLTLVAVSCLPTNTVSVTTETPIASLDDTLIIYTTIADNEITSGGSSTYYAFRTAPSLPFLDPLIFNTFYGESEQIDPIGMFLDEFHPQLSPNRRYLLVPGLTSYPEIGIQGTGTWLLDLKAKEARMLLPNGVIATWSPNSDAITYVEGDTLYTLRIEENARPESLFQNSHLWPLYAKWSPDGRWIATVTGVQRQITEPDQADLILTYWLIPVNNDPPLELTVQEDFAMEYSSSEMSWSPDGQFLLMRNKVFNLQGNLLSSNYSGRVHWLPGTSSLVNDSGEGLLILSIAGDEIARISDTPAGAWSISRNGLRLAYDLLPTDDGIPLAIYDLESGETQIVGNIPDALRINSLHWSADDGLLITEVEHEEGRYDIWALPVAPNSTAERLLADAVLIDAVPYPP